MPDTQLEAVHPVLPAVDLPSTIEFYVQQLGFQVAFEDAQPPRYVGLTRDRVEIHLRQTSPTEQVAGLPSGNVEVHFAVCDVDHFFNQCLDGGVIDPTDQLRDTPWGTREFSIADPEGNRLTFYSDLG